MSEPNCVKPSILVDVPVSVAKDPIFYTMIVAIAIVFLFIFSFVDFGREGAKRNGYTIARTGMNALVLLLFLVSFGMYGSENTNRQFYNATTGDCIAGSVSDFVAYPRIRQPVDTVAVVCATLGVVAFMSSWVALAARISDFTDFKDTPAAKTVSMYVPFILRILMIAYLSTQSSLAFGWASGRSVTGFQPETPRTLLFAAGMLLSGGLLATTLGLLAGTKAGAHEDYSAGVHTPNVMGIYFVEPKTLYFPLVNYTTGAFAAAVAVFQYGFAISVYTHQGQAISYFFLFGLLPLLFAVIARNMSYFIPYFLMMNGIAYSLVYVLASVADPSLNYLLLEPVTVDTGAYDNGLYGVAMLTFILAAGYAVGPVGRLMYAAIVVVNKANLTEEGGVYEQVREQGLRAAVQTAPYHEGRARHDVVVAEPGFGKGPGDKPMNEGRRVVPKDEQYDAW